MVLGGLGIKNVGVFNGGGKFVTREMICGFDVFRVWGVVREREER